MGFILSYSILRMVFVCILLYTNIHLKQCYILFILEFADFNFPVHYIMIYE